MKHFLLTTLIITIMVSNSLLSMDRASDPTKKSTGDCIQAQQKLFKLNDTHPDNMQITCGTRSQEATPQEMGALKTALFDCLKSIEDKPIKRNLDDSSEPIEYATHIDISSLKSLTLLQPTETEDAQARKLRLLQTLTTNVKVFKDGQEVRNIITQDLIEGLLSAIDAIEETQEHGVIINVSKLHKLPTCTRERTPTQIKPTWKQQLIHPTTGVVLFSGLALGYLACNQMGNQ